MGARNSSVKHQGASGTSWSKCIKKISKRLSRRNGKKFLQDAAHPKMRRGYIS